MACFTFCTSPGPFGTGCAACQKQMRMLQADRAPTSFLKATFQSFLHDFCASETDTVHDSPQGASVVHSWGHRLESVAKCVTFYMESSRMHVSLSIYLIKNE